MIGYHATAFYARWFMAKSGPRLRANRKRQQALISALRQIREDAGLRQVDVADSLRVPQSVISKYESGERRLDLLELEDVCRAIGTTLSEFVKYYERNVASTTNPRSSMTSGER
jgi:transcriptional regulator with XRE-family HTH domain